MSNTEKKQRKSPVPQDAGRILAGALKLELKERVDLRNALTDSITEELLQMDKEREEMERKHREAKEYVKEK